jgi:hypothetical protein
VINALSRGCDARGHGGSECQGLTGLVISCHPATATAASISIVSLQLSKENTPKISKDYGRLKRRHLSIVFLREMQRSDRANMTLFCWPWPVISCDVLWLRHAKTPHTWVQTWILLAPGSRLSSAASTSRLFKGFLQEEYPPCTTYKQVSQLSLDCKKEVLRVWRMCKHWFFSPPNFRTAYLGMIQNDILGCLSDSASNIIKRVFTFIPSSPNVRDVFAKFLDALLFVRCV